MLGKQEFTLVAQRTISSTDGYTSRAVTSNYHRGAVITIDRESETGTATLDASLEYKNQTTGTWAQVEGTSWVQWADGATGERYLYIYPGNVGAEADAMVPLDTSKGVHSSAFLPRVWRVALVTTGTTNVVSVNVCLLP